MDIKIAKSKSGHDKGHYYVILKEDESFLYLSDGIRKTVEKPKRKKRKHVQIVNRLPDQIAGLLSEEQTDLTIKRALKLYQKIIMPEQVNDI